MPELERQHPEVAQPIRRSIIEQVQLDHGPVAKLGRFLLEAESYVKSRGIDLSIATAHELLACNQANSDTWKPIFGVFDPRNGKLDDSNFFAIIGRNARGQVVAAGAARRYDWHDTTLADEVASLRFYYDDPEAMRRDGESGICNTVFARDLTGRVIFSGAAWYHPEYRGQRLSHYIPRMVKAIAVGRWNPNFIMSVMIDTVHARGFTKMLSYTHLDWSIDFKNTSLGDFRCALLWMSGDDVIRDVDNELDTTLRRAPTEVDRQVFKRAAQE